MGEKPGPKVDHYGHLWFHQDARVNRNYVLSCFSHVLVFTLFCHQLTNHQIAGMKLQYRHGVIHFDALQYVSSGIMLTWPYCIHSTTHLVPVIFPSPHAMPLLGPYPRVLSIHILINVVCCYEQVGGGFYFILPVEV